MAALARNPLDCFSSGGQRNNDTWHVYKANIDGEQWLVNVYSYGYDPYHQMHSPCQ